MAAADGSEGVKWELMARTSGDSQQAAGRSDNRSARRRAAPAGANPTVRQRELGMRLRELRNAAEFTVEQVGERLLCSATKISRLETGARRASLRDVRDLCGIYGVTDKDQVEDLMTLASRAREPGWWKQYEDAILSPYIGLEQAAVAITVYSMSFVPALIQTSDYARATIKSIERKIDPAILDRRVEVRLRRQELLDRPAPPRYRVLLDEAVLRRQVGGAAVMHAQLDKIVACAAEEKLTVQVIPFDVGVYPSTDSNVVLLEFAEESPQGPIVFVEGLLKNKYYEHPAEIARYREAMEYLRDAAGSPRDSIGLITQIRDIYRA
jgi:transcriptional regulator with XRE-family HTH domain